MSNNNFIAVAMSIYKNDNADYVKEAIQSILSQKNVDLDLYIQVDGGVGSGLNDLLDTYSLYDNIFIEKFPENKGLAYQLNVIINKVYSADKYRFLARMDADDISDEMRFTTQIEFLNNNPKISIVGSDVIEFKDSSDSGSFFYKKMPSEHKDLLDSVIKRCPLNHPSVMFNIENIPRRDLCYNAQLANTQDYYLWVDLFSKDYQFANINKPLLKFRIDESFYKRRGFAKAMNDFKSRIYAMNKLGRWSIKSITFVILLFALRISPSFVKEWAYRYMR